MNDWTVDPETGRSNSSEKYNELCKLVESLIRGDAFMLINGRADETARMIVSHLAEALKLLHIIFSWLARIHIIHIHRQYNKAGACRILGF